MKNIKYLIVGLALVMMAGACTKDFEEINTNPNGPSEVTPALLLPAAIEWTMDEIAREFIGHDMSCWAQHIAKIQYTDEDRYIYRTGVVNTTWERLYARGLTDIQDIEMMAMNEDDPHPNYEGIAKIWKSYIYSCLTDIWGDIPYSEALKAAAEESINTPKYDAQSDIYPALVAEIKAGVAKLDVNGPDVDGDILLGGDIAMWKKFGNSLALRLLMRASDVYPGVQAEFEAIVNSGVIIQSNSDNTVLEYLNDAPNNHPLAENRKTRDDYRVSKSLIDRLLATGDNRILVYAEEADDGSGYIGVPNGILADEVDGIGGLGGTSKMGRFFTAHYLDGTGAYKSNDFAVPHVLINYAEVMFLIAEAANLGWSVGITAADAYADAVEASFMQFDGVVYDNAGTAFDGAAEYAAFIGANPYTDLPSIWTQKWVAMYGQDIQPWCEQRRTGWPQLAPALNDDNDGVIPTRWPYPLDEQSLNEDSWLAAKTAMGGDDLKTKLWWDTK